MIGLWCLSSLSMIELFKLFDTLICIALVAQKSGQWIGSRCTTRQYPSNSRQICFSSGLDRCLERRCHHWQISCGCKCCICHDRRCTHFHCFTRLRWFSNTGIYNDRKVNLIDQYLNKLLVANSLLDQIGEANGITQDAPAFTRSLAVLRSGYIYGITTNPSFARISVARIVS